MPKNDSIFLCQHCGHRSPKWLGKCPSCGQWNSFAEEKVVAAPVTAARYAETRLATLRSPLKPITEISPTEALRFSSGILELDRLLGGGLVPGSLILLGGDPGIGKSTLILQILGFLSKTGPVLYLSGEESAQQIKLRAERLGISSPNLFVLSENNLREALSLLDTLRPAFFVVDSIQTVFLPEFESAPGSLTQVKECTTNLLYVAKNLQITTCLIGHMTKEGMIAGPKVLEHLVDTVLYFEGDKGQPYRLLRTNKNRFGSTNEVGVFEMASAGLLSVENPSVFFLSDAAEQSPGSVVVSSLEGSKPFLVEVQVLTTASHLALPRRVSLGFDANRLALLVAILEKTTGFQLSGQDLFLNVVGGFRLQETGADLGILAALTSSFLGRPVSKKTVFIGEVGLGGEIRNVPHLELRLGEIERLGFEKAFVPSQKNALKKRSLELVFCKNLSELLQYLK